MLFNGVVAEGESENRGIDISDITRDLRMENEVARVEVDMRGMKKHSKGHHHRKGRKPGRLASEVQNEVISSTSAGGFLEPGSFFNTVALVDTGTSITSLPASPASSDSSPTPTSTTSDPSTSTSSSLDSTITPSPISSHRKHKHHHSNSSSVFHNSSGQDSSASSSILKEGPTVTKLISITTQIVSNSSNKNHRNGKKEEGDKIIITELATTTQKNELTNGENETVV